MCLTCDLKYLNAKFGTGTAGIEATARYIAQWAVNAVDFKSPGSAMTPFDYDPQYANGAAITLTGWTPPCNSLHRVWGCKRPELLISETLAFHDRRTQDTATEIVDTTDTAPPAAPLTGQARADHRSGQISPEQHAGKFDQALSPPGFALLRALQSHVAHGAALRRSLHRRQRNARPEGFGPNRHVAGVAHGHHHPGAEDGGIGDRRADSSPTPMSPIQTTRCSTSSRAMSSGSYILGTSPGRSADQAVGGWIGNVLSQLHPTTMPVGPGGYASSAPAN